MKWIALIFPPLFLASYTIDDPGSRVIYGEDHRQDVRDYAKPLYRKYARAVAAKVRKSRLIPNQKKDTYRLDYRTLETRGYCPEERFYEQPTLSLCTGFLIAPDLLVTAGHCVKNASECNLYSWVFNFEVDANGKVPTTIPASEVYECAEVVEAVYEFLSLEDHSLLRLDRVAKGREPLPFRREGQPEVDTPLVVISHPLGLPKKISDGGKVRKRLSPYRFKANLDTYDGSSGAPVFNAELGIVEGVLTAGEKDEVYMEEEECFLSQVCENNACYGEDVHWITNIDYLAKLP